MSIRITFNSRHPPGRLCPRDLQPVVGLHLGDDAPHLIVVVRLDRGQVDRIRAALAFE
jgi:hypothetical protein